MQHKRLFVWSITAALAGFLFGFDAIVISGAEQKIESIWKLGPVMHGLCMSAALWGTVLGSLLGAWPTEKYGRRRTLIWIGALYFISAVGSGIAPERYFFMIARFIGGLGVGVATVASPLYISEISPARLRGRLAGMFQFNIVFGILVAFVSNYFLGKYLNEQIAWRWMLGVESIPAFFYFLMCLTIPESPRWLIVHGGQREQGLEVFRKINPGLSESDIAALGDSVAASAGDRQTSAKFFTKRLKVPIMLAFLVAFFNQLSGVNAILFFAPRIFEWTGLGESVALLQSVGIGVTNLIFTFAGLYLIDKVGRRMLLYIGSFGYILSLGICSWAFYAESYKVVPLCIFAFIAAHAIGQGTVIWVLISEIFPNRNRAAGQALGSFTHWYFAASLTLVFPKMADLVSPAIIFGFFCFMMVLQLVWVKTMVPETKGVSLEEMQHKLGIDN